jgi:hypothetical protein
MGSLMSSTINASTASGGGVITTADASGILQLQTAGTTAVTIDASQNVSFTKAINKAALPTGSVLQVVYGATGTEKSSSTNTQIATGLTVTITPLFSTSKILVIAMLNGCYKANTAITSITSYLTRNGVNQQLMSYVGAGNGLSQENEVGTIGINYLDSPATTSATTYACTFASQQNNASVRVQIYGAVSSMTLMEIAA